MQVRQKILGLNPWVGKVPWRRAWQPTPVFLPGESHGQRSLGLQSIGLHRIGHNGSNVAQYRWSWLVSVSKLLIPRTQTSLALRRSMERHRRFKVNRQMKWKVMDQFKIVSLRGNKIWSNSVANRDVHDDKERVGKKLDIHFLLEMIYFDHHPICWKGHRENQLYLTLSNIYNHNIISNKNRMHFENPRHNGPFRSPNAAKMQFVLWHISKAAAADLCMSLVNSDTRWSPWSHDDKMKDWLGHFGCKP